MALTQVYKKLPPLPHVLNHKCKKRNRIQKHKQDKKVLENKQKAFRTVMLLSFRFEDT